MNMSLSWVMGGGVGERELAGGKVTNDEERMAVGRLLIHVTKSGK